MLRQIGKSSRISASILFPSNLRSMEVQRRDSVLERGFLVLTAAERCQSMPRARFLLASRRLWRRRDRFIGLAPSWPIWCRSQQTGSPADPAAACSVPRRDRSSLLQCPRLTDTRTSAGHGPFQLYINASTRTSQRRGIAAAVSDAHMGEREPGSSGVGQSLVRAAATRRDRITPTALSQNFMALHKRPALPPIRVHGGS